MSSQGKKVFVGMSGGVDSSVAAALLKKRGFNVVGVHIKCWSPSDDCSQYDIEDARRVSAILDIPFFVWNFEQEYKARVVDYMVDGYRRGVTPNPDVMCNKEIKFGLFLEKAMRLGADYIATGHYVKKKNDNTLAIATDKNKDQSYFLWALTEAQITRALFPLSGYQKSEVRDLARKFNLPVAEKKDSQGICFMGKVTMSEFLEDNIPKNPGRVITTGGDVVGEHKGVNFYTIGQRHGIGIGGGTPYYVAQKDRQTNTLVVAEGNKDEELFKSEVVLSDVNLVGGVNIPGSGLRTRARVRYRQPLFSAIISREASSRYNLVFDSPQKYVAVGQSAVFYSDIGTMLGGGVIVA